MRYRAVFAALAVAVMILGAQVAVGQQPHKPARIGVLAVNACPDAAHPFINGLAELGYVIDRDIMIECVLAGDRIDRLPELADELVRRNVDIITAGSTSTVLAAQRATQTIPIVMISGADAVREGLVASLARPGGHTTGVTLSGIELAGKRLELLREMVPRLKRLAVLIRRGGAGEYSDTFLHELRTVAQPLAIATSVIEAGNASEILAAFDEAMARDRPDAVYVSQSPLFSGQAELIGALARRDRLPAVSSYPALTRAGGLIAYGPSYDHMFRLAANYVDRILRGAKPADLPIQQPTRFELVLNAATARALGIEIPASLLARADEVIE